MAVCRDPASHRASALVSKRTLLKVAAWPGIASLGLSGCASTMSSTDGGQGITRETFTIPSEDPTIRLHVRNKRPAREQSFPGSKIVLMVHGGTYPAETVYDLPLPGGSWLDHMASRGFDAYLVDVRGYGRSTRPAAMSQPASAGVPFADAAEGVKDIEAVVDFILKRRSASKLNLLGWSWGTQIMGAFATANPQKVEKLVLYAPLFIIHGAPPVTGAGAYRAVSRETARQRGIRGIPPDRVEEISPRAWFDQWFDGNLATDPVGAAQSPPVVRAPNGAIKDISEILMKGRSMYEPENIRVPVLLAVGEWDQDTPLPMVQEVFSRIKSSPDKRLLVFGEGTHQLALEKHRMRLIQEVQQFLES